MLFVTGILSGVVEKFNTRINQDKADPDAQNILKLFLYSDHDDSIVALSTAFNYVLPHYPPYASQILFELWKNETSLDYYVRLFINDANVTLEGACQNNQICSFGAFTDLIKSITFYQRETEYQSHCKNPLISIEQP